MNTSPFEFARKCITDCPVVNLQFDSSDIMLDFAVSMVSDLSTLVITNN